MKSNDRIYRDLQRHLNEHSFGYPATKSGVEIRLLKRFFQPEEAKLAMELSHRPRSAREIYQRVEASGVSFEKIQGLLDAMTQNGTIGHLEKDGTRYFYTIPLVVGMYEGQLYKLTPELIADVDEYTSDRGFGLDFLGTKLPQMRTIPVEQSIEPEHSITTYDHLKSLITETNGPIVIHECLCRKAAEMKGKPCQMTTRLETCMAFGDTAKNSIRAGTGREIDTREALNIARENQADGLILQPGNSQRVEFICACCGCCCGMLRLHKFLPKPVEFWSTNYQARVDPESCTGCQTCVSRCQVNAVIVDEQRRVAIVDLNRCLGCGNCVTTCPAGAVQLIKKEQESIPPETSEELYDTIMENKIGRFGKIRLATRLMLKR